MTEEQSSLNPLRELPAKLYYAFEPLRRVEVLTGWAGYVLAGYGIHHGNTKQIVGGLALSALSGLYCAYKDGCFSQPPGASTPSGLETKLES
ncbi:MAG: hypothetical protein AABX70_08955 [Nanoarchaeota archaeon]